MARHYVDNKQLYTVIIDYKTRVAEAKKLNKEKPQIPDYVGLCILQIANRLSTKPNFINYSYREEMISDGIENCISYFDNFDPAKSDNPFAYFTQIIYYAFLRRIQKEKKQVYTKHKIAENNIVFEEAFEVGDNDDFVMDFSQFDAENISEFMRSFEENIERKKLKKKKGLEMFIDEDADEDSIVG
jgi:hypothetical protein